MQQMLDIRGAVLYVRRHALPQSSKVCWGEGRSEHLWTHMKNPNTITGSLPATSTSEFSQGYLIILFFLLDLCYLNTPGFSKTE